MKRLWRGPCSLLVTKDNRPQVVDTYHLYDDAMMGMLEQRDRLRDQGYRVVDWGMNGLPGILMEIGRPPMRVEITVRPQMDSQPPPPPVTPKKAWRQIPGLGGSAEAETWAYTAPNGTWYGAVSAHKEAGRIHWTAWYRDSEGNPLKHLGYDYADRDAAMQAVERRFSR